MNNQQLIDLLRDDRSTALAAMTDAQCHRLTEHGYLGREDYDRRDNIICALETAKHASYKSRPHVLKGIAL